MGKGLDTGTAFWKGVLGKITDPEQRAAAELLAKNSQVMTEIGNGVEGQSEIDRRLQELTTKTTELETKRTELEQQEQSLTQWHSNLTTWRAANNELLELGKKAKATGGTPAAPAAPKTGEPAPGTITEEVLGKHLTEQANSFLGFERDRNKIQREHFAKFKEIVDLEPLLAHPQIREIGLEGVYQLVHKEALEKFQADQKKAEEDRIRADERQKVQAANANLPYPTPTGVSSGSPLDALKPPEGGGPLVDQAVAEYNRLQAAKGAPA